MENWLHSATQTFPSPPATSLHRCISHYFSFCNLFSRTISVNLNGFCGISGGSWYFKVQSHSYVNFHKINIIKACFPKLDLNMSKWVWSNCLWKSLFGNEASLSLAEAEARIISECKSFCSFTHDKYNFNWLNFFNESWWNKKKSYSFQKLIKLVFSCKNPSNSDINIIKWVFLYLSLYPKLLLISTKR